MGSGTVTAADETKIEVRNGIDTINAAIRYFTLAKQAMGEVDVVLNMVGARHSNQNVIRLSLNTLVQSDQVTDDVITKLSRMAEAMTVWESQL